MDWNDPEARRKYNRDYARKKYATDPEFKAARKEASRRWLYGTVTAERMAQMALEQNGQCYLCDTPLDFTTPKAITVDHDHDCCPPTRSGKSKMCGACVRGLTCARCNQAIGQFNDDPELMRRVADNLEAANRRLR